MTEFQLEAPSEDELQELAQIAALDRALWPALLAALVDVAAVTLARVLRDEEAAEAAARQVVAAIARYHGGRSTYLPSGKDLELALVHDAIYRASKRGNALALARQHGYSQRRIEQITAAQTALRRAKMQGQLFPINEGVEKK